MSWADVFPKDEWAETMRLLKRIHIKALRYAVWLWVAIAFALTVEWIVSWFVVVDEALNSPLEILASIISVRSILAIVVFGAVSCSGVLVLDIAALSMKEGWARERVHWLRRFLVPNLDEIFDALFLVLALSYAFLLPYELFTRKPSGDYGLWAGTWLLCCGFVLVANMMVKEFSQLTSRRGRAFLAVAILAGAGTLLAMALNMSIS